MVRFGGYELDEQARELRCDGSPVHLEPQAFDVLVHLVRNRGRVVSNQELLDSVWGHRFVSESALTTRIKEARRAVGDDGRRQEVIRNVRGRGYRFLPEVSDAAAGEEAPPAAGIEPRPGLVGREADIGGVLARLGRSRLVSIVGPGGVGKTTLATEVARRWRATEGRPVRTVALAELTPGGAVVAAVAEATGVMADSADRDRVVEALADRAELLVIDNCEHLVGEVAEVVADLLDAAPALVVLTTSRERLGLASEQMWPLLPLGAHDARTLFLARAAAAGVDPASIRPGVADHVVAAVDGLPLALEMAAAQLAVLDPAEVEELVAQRSDLLRSPSRAAPARHRTLDALVRWSLDLLDPSDRALLGELGVFVGSATAADVAAVLGGPADPLDPLEVSARLADLCGRSLLTAEGARGSTRFRLPEVVRAVAAREPDLVVDGRRGALRASHARHHVELAERCDAALRGPEERWGHDRLTDSIPDLRVAHTWAAEHSPGLATELAAALHLFAYTRLWGEPAAWARGRDAPGDAVQAAVAAADAANRSRLDEALALAAAASRSDDRRARAIGLEVLTDVALYRGELDDSARHAEQLRRLGIDAADPHLEVVGLLNLALTAGYQHRRDDALGPLDELLRLRAHLAPSDQAWCDFAVGELTASDDPASALDALRAAIAGAEAVGNRLVPCVARTTLATSLARLGDHPAALDAYAACIEEAIAFGNSTQAATILRNLVGLLLDVDDTRHAALLLGALEGAGKATFGDEAGRLAAARDALTGRAPTSQLDRWLAEGTSTSIDQALRVALAAVDGQRRRG